MRRFADGARRSRRWWEVTERGLLVLVGALAIIWVVVAAVPRGEHAESEWGSARPGGVPSGTELLLVLVVSSDCVGVDDPEFLLAYRDIVTSLSAGAEVEGNRFTTMGVAIDNGVGPGLDVLRRFAPFNQVHAGGGWLNNSAVNYIWRGIPGTPSVPQLILVERTIESERHINVGHDRVLFRKAGAQAIIEWNAARAKESLSAAVP